VDSEKAWRINMKTTVEQKRKEKRTGIIGGEKLGGGGE
jgi:hypothetical protein